MSESPVVRRSMLCGAVVIALCFGVLASVQPAGAAHRRVAATTAGMSPSPAPVPALLPDGYAPDSATLFASSCSSTAFCVAVGTVKDSLLDSYPLVETYDGETWTASIAPVPANADGGEADDEVLYSVSCPVDGTCAAVGNYNDFNGTVQHQNGLLETLSDGTWTASEGALPTGPDSGLVNVRSVSCSDATTCVAVGDLYDGGSKTVPAVWGSLVYLWTSGTWQLETAIPIPASYVNSLALSSVSCPDASDCVVVGSYEDGTSSQGLILTLASGVWSAQEATVPANANPEPNAEGLHVLDTVDCVDAADCVAGGAYVDTDGNIDPLLDVLQSGTWTPEEAPVPPDSQTNTLAAITGMSCPAVGACQADGYYWPDYLAGDESGMVLTQSGDDWSVTPAPVPVTATGRAHIRDAAPSATFAARLDAIACLATGPCMAVGQFGSPSGDSQGLIVSLPAGQPAAVAITSATGVTLSDHKASSFTVTATGDPTPVITEQGKLPKGLHFRTGTGSARILGKPSTKKPGRYPVTIIASSGATSRVDQYFTVIVSR